MGLIALAVTVGISACDGGSSTTVVATVEAVRVEPLNGTLHQAESLQFTATSRDAQGNVLTGREVNWSSSSPGVATVNPAGTVTGASTGTATITANVEGRTGQATVTVRPIPVATVSVQPSRDSVAVGAELQLTATPRDANGNVLQGRSVTWSASNNARASVNASGVVRGISTGSVTITATSEGRSGSASITVTPAPVAPSITTNSLPGGTVGVGYSATLQASGGRTPYTWSLASGSLPNGLGLSTSGTISGTPSSGGTSSFAVRVIGADGLSATRSLSIQVTAAPQAPSITTSSLPGGTVGQSYSQSLQATGGTTPYAWSLASGSLPAGLGLASGGTISGTPSSAGTSSFTVRVTGGDGLSSTRPVSIQVSPASEAPTITTGSLPSGTVGQGYNQTLQATGGIQPYAWSMASGSLPSGLSLSSGGTISGNPSNSGTSSFTVRVTGNDGLSSTRSLLITISAAPEPPSANFVVGCHGLLCAVIDESSGPIESWAWDFGDGTNYTEQEPTHTYSESGTYTITLTVTSPAGLTDSHSETVAVEPLGEAPTITTSSLPNGTMGESYSEMLRASGGTTPYSWSLASASLPSGLSLSSGGTISGTPSSAGTSSFTVRVTGGDGLSSTRALSIAVQSVEPVLFFLDGNGVTVRCPDAEVGDTGVVNGITYTKRTRDQITPQNASTTCTSGITDMSALFAAGNIGTQNFNEPIGSWDVSSVTNMGGMFRDSFFNQSIGSWDVRNVRNMSAMFDDSYFNQDISGWDVSSVTNMSMMFRWSVFDQPIEGWNVGGVTNMDQMFFGSFSFNRDLSAWCVSNIPSRPFEFDSSARSWTLPRPIWGTCPGGQ